MEYVGLSRASHIWQTAYKINKQKIRTESWTFSVLITWILSVYSVVCSSWTCWIIQIDSYDYRHARNFNTNTYTSKHDIQHKYMQTRYLWREPNRVMNVYCDVCFCVYYVLLLCIIHNRPWEIGWKRRTVCVQRVYNWQLGIVHV